MNRRTFFIILAAVAFAVIVGLVWFWFFRGGGAPAPTGGSFGTGQDRPGSIGTGSGANNIPSSIPPSGQGTTGAATNQGGSGSGGTIDVGSIGSVGAPGGLASVPGVDWLGGTNPTASGPITNFVPKTANQLNDGSVGGTPGLLGTNLSGQNSANNGLDLGLAGLFGAGAGCALYAAFTAAGEAQAGGEVAGGATGGMVLVMDWRLNSKQATTKYKDIGDCLARTIGKAVIQQMTNSIVNWINSGFNGKPAFVTNFQQFFSNVGDQAAGEFIRGTALSFLCSPFQAQIRIAIAQSYARRNAASCTLTGIVKNINGFMNGNFSQGGWGGLLSFTTMPTNNPFGAYAYAQGGLITAQQNALNNANRNLSPGGFISLQKCDPPNSKRPEDCKVVTPGKIIEGTLEETLKQPFLANQLAKSFDEIIGALLNQLVTRTLYQGLSTLSSSQGLAADYLTPAEQQAQVAAQGLLTDMQGRLLITQQYGSVWQGAIADIQNTQQRLNALANCYSTKNKSELASSTLDIINTYNIQVDLYNEKITATNGAIALLQDLQTRVISVITPSDVVAVQSAYQTALANGSIPSQADVTNAQQDRATLQSALASRNQQTAADLQQCNAIQ